jgi:hypothetical protein
MTQLSEYEQKSLKKFGEAALDGKWSDEGILQLIEVAGGFINLMTPTQFALKFCISDRAARNDTLTRKNRKVLGVNFVYDSN